jgi:hypothetical protein
MHRLWLFGGVLVVAVAILAFGANWLNVAEPATTLPLEPMSQSGVTGTVTITPGTGRDESDDGVSLTLDVKGLTPGRSYPVHLHTGHCAQPSASASRLGTLVADPAGRATLTTTEVRGSAAGPPVPLTRALLADGDHIVDVRGTRLAACASLRLA